MSGCVSHTTAARDLMMNSPISLLTLIRCMKWSSYDLLYHKPGGFCSELTARKFHQPPKTLTKATVSCPAFVSRKQQSSIGARRRRSRSLQAFFMWRFRLPWLPTLSRDTSTRPGAGSGAGLANALELPSRRMLIRGPPLGHSHHSQRSPWLRATVLGAMDGCVFTKRGCRRMLLFVPKNTPPYRSHLLLTA